uniref:Rhodanese domain-containing protein n=1 Tax=Zooxanthella nutricula TaxID=1333877 RepID=A0A7S2LJX1_9DINO
MGEEEPRSLMIPSLNSYAVSVTVPGSPEEDIPLADQLLEGIHIPPPPAPYGSGKSPSRRGSMEGGSMARGSSESVMSAGSLFSTGSGESKRDWKPEFKVVIKRSSTGVLDERPKNESRGAFKRASTGQQSRRRSSQGRGSLKRRSMPMQEAVSRRGSLVGMTMDGRRASGGVLAVPATPSIQAQDVKVSKKESRWESQFAMRRSTLLEAARFLDAAGPLQDALTSSQATQELQRAVGSKAPTGEAILGSQESPKSPKSPKLGMGLLPDFDGDAAKPGRAGSAAESRRSSLASSGDSEIVPSPRSSADKKTLGAAAAADGGEKPGAEAAADGGGKQPRYSILLTRQATQKMANNRKSVSIKVPSALKLAEEADDDGDDACRTPDELEELESEEDGSPRGKAKNKRASDLAMLDMQVLHYDQSPINFSLMGSLPKEGTEDTSDSNSDDDEGDGSELEDEYWSQSEDQQVEVPVWLLEKMKRQEAQKEQEESRRPSTPPVGLPKFEEDEDAEDSDMVGELPAAPQPKAAPPQGSKRISFHDQVTGTSFERYSILKNQGEKAPSKTVQLAVRSASDGACFATSASPFWKIPMPTRKNTMMTAPTYSAETDEEDDESEKASSSTGLVPPHKVLRQPPAPKFKPPQKELKQPAGKEDNRRPSVLGVFSNDGAKAAGLYALPASSEEKSELVEVKRRSIVMSTNMLHDILKAKVDDERFDTIQEDFDKVDAEVVLPFFSAVKGAFRQCHCQTDPETGFVIHTCMTPAATQCENTQAFQSFVCSAWSSRRGSRKQSEAASRARSRRGSCEEDEDGEGSEEDDTIGPLPSGHERPSHPALLSTPGSGPPAPNKNKRIRNASMLAIVGAAGPAPQKQNTDATLSQHEKEKKKQQKGGQSDDSDSSDEGMPEENELNVSFKNIQPTEQESPDGALSPEGMGSDPSMPKPDSASVPQTDKKALDQQVESDLGHRFELVEPWQLAALLKNREQREHILTVDVRGRDWVGGHIPLSINLHTSEVLRHPESLINQCLRNKIHHLVFTCMYSVLRARKSALAVEQAQMEAQKSGLQTYRIRISLLAGGMHAWVNHFVRVSPQKALVQDFDAECWSDGGPSQGGLVHVMDALWSSGGQKALSDALTAELSALMHARGCSSRDGSRRASNNDITTEVN